MTAVALTALAIPGFTATNSEEVNWIAADVDDGNSFAFTGREIVLVRNVSVDTAADVTVTARVPYDDFVETIPFGEQHVLPFLTTRRYQQTNRTVLINGETDDIEFAILRLPT